MPKNDALKTDVDAIKGKNNIKSTKMNQSDQPHRQIYREKRHFSQEILQNAAWPSDWFGSHSRENKFCEFSLGWLVCKYYDSMRFTAE